MTETEIRAMTAERAVEHTLLRSDNTLSEEKLEYLVAAAKKTVEWKDSVTSGTRFDVHNCVAAVRASDVGKMIFGDDICDHAVTEKAQRLAEINAITNPQERINTARREGFTGLEHGS